jgi:tRNA threonylcarbamoyladenosine biosynthesis protein TsaB
MSLILHIDTAAGNAFVNIAKDGVILQSANNGKQNDHASFLQPAVQTVINAAGINLQEIDAVAVNFGPGSYTGLRVGMASAKGLCFALNKPLIVLNGLEVLAKAILVEYADELGDAPYFCCPMIDARRMEVFTAVYDFELSAIFEPGALVLEENSFKKILLNNKIIFSGSGAAKWAEVCKHPNAAFLPVSGNDLAMNILSFEKFKKKDFVNIIYAEPLYLKEFYGGLTTN